MALRGKHSDLSRRTTRRCVSAVLLSISPPWVRSEEQHVCIALSAEVTYKPTAKAALG